MVDIILIDYYNVNMDIMENQRTIQQNKALHKFFSMLATELNDAGLDMKKVLKPEVEIPWTPATIKEHLWKPVQNAMLLKRSTTEMTTKDVTDVYEVLIRHLGKLGIYVEFPSNEENT